MTADLTMTETFHVALCESCWATTKHSTLRDVSGLLPAMVECGKCGWVTEEVAR